MSDLPLITHVIDGEAVESADGARFVNVNPWTQAPIADVALGGRPEVEAAIQAARVAFDSGPWRTMGFTERGRLIHALADLVDMHADALAEADARDVGKPITLVRNFEVPRVAVNLRAFADHARLSLAETYPNDLGAHVYTRYEPAGVVVAIVPWNVPLMMLSWKIAPALAWGNTVVIKPAEDSPSSATMFANLATEAGFPPGVLNVVHGFGGGGAGELLTQSAAIDRITFTGETTTGRAISRNAAENLVPVSLELGGRSAHIVFADADMGSVVKLAATASFMNSGQICFAGNRIFVERAAYEEFTERFADAAAALRMGDPLDRETDAGPLASEAHFRKVVGYLETIAADGGVVRTGGVGEGWAVRPTVVTDLPLDSRAAREEIFGPVAIVAPFDSEDEAVAHANDTHYGLSTLLSTSDAGRTIRLAPKLNGGMLWINTFPFRDPRAPYGGLGDSGIGREGGSFSRDFFTEPKQVVVGA